MQPIILASASPRRQDFFRLLGLPFTCIPAEIDETPPEGLNPRQAAEAIALRKVMAIVEKVINSQNSHAKIAKLAKDSRKCENSNPTLRTPRTLREVFLKSPFPTPHSPQWIFGADTMVVLENEIFGKPADRSAAKFMLERLSGRRHEVITAMALYNGQTQSTDCRSAASEVVFAPLSGAEIDWYLDCGEWEGAAGAYRLQGRGACFISSINGSPSGVAGLPLHEFYAMLKSNGCPLGG